MNNRLKHRFEKWLFWLSLALVIYMPLHVFLSQSLSLVTGGLEVWKAAKDVIVFLSVPVILWTAWKQNLFENKYIRWILYATALYSLLHFAYVLFDRDDDTFSAIIATAYNLRILIYFALGAVVGASLSVRNRRIMFTVVVLVASLVSLFAIAQYFLPHDMLENVGYSVERGVKPMFFIDDNPDLPRVMSTLRDPNSLGAYLILPILMTGYAFLSRRVNNELFTRPFRRGVLGVMIAMQFLALFLTFSRGALLGLILAVVALLSIVNRERAGDWLKKYWYIPIAVLLLSFGSLYALRDSSLVQDYILHAAETTDEADPNQKRVSLQVDALESIINDFDGKGPGTAGLVAIRNPQGGILTENYYLQIGYEVGWLGITAFIFIFSIIVYRLLTASRQSPLASILLSAAVAYAFYSLLIHLWSNEAVALQWWLLGGLVVGSAKNFSKKRT